MLPLLLNILYSMTSWLWPQWSPPLPLAGLPCKLHMFPTIAVLLLSDVRAAALASKPCPLVLYMAPCLVPTSIKLLAIGVFFCHLKDII
jgi:hypothetical protein